MNIPNLSHLRDQPAEELQQSRRELLRLIPGLQRAESAIGRELRRRERADKKRAAKEVAE